MHLRNEHIKMSKAKKGLIARQTLQFKIRLRTSGNWDKLVIFDHIFVERFLLASSASLHSLLYSVFPLPDSDSYSNSDWNGWYINVQNCFHWTYSDSYSDADGYCTQFDTDIHTNKVVFEVIFIVALHQNDHWNWFQWSLSAHYGNRNRNMNPPRSLVVETHQYGD